MEDPKYADNDAEVGKILTRYLLRASERHGLVIAYPVDTPLCDIVPSVEYKKIQLTAAVALMPTCPFCGFKLPSNVSSDDAARGWIFSNGIKHYHCKEAAISD